ncbi:hypothetical protein ACS0TY_024590 [Phlomoides rotata]
MAESIGKEVLSDDDTDKLVIGIENLDVTSTDINLCLIHDLQVGAFIEGVGILLGNYVGRFVEYDSSNKGAVWRPYMRIRVEVSVDDPLKTGRGIKIANGATAMVLFKYERLNLFCFLCGRLGHTESYCELSLVEEECSKPRKWGS